MDENLCRSCSSSINDKESAKNLFSDCCRYREFLEMLLGEKLLIIEGMPYKICERCQSEVDLALKFQDRIIFSQKYLYDMLIKTKGNELAAACAMEENKVVDVQDEDNQSEDNPFEKFVNGLMDENSIDDYDDDENITEHKDNIESDFKNLEVEQEATINRIVEEEEEEDYSEFDRHRRILNLFYCEQCDRYYNDENKFRTHLQHHAGKKHYQCKVCPAQFRARYELNRHVLIHTKRRQFECPQCNKRFSDHDSMLRHDSGHVNEQSYPCQECEKDFSTANELKYHTLTHSQVRKYICNVCNKGFVRQSHLDVHYHTEFHLKNVQQKTELENTAMMDEYLDYNSSDKLV